MWRKVRREAVVDTNAIIYYVVEDSPMHVEAETLLDGLDVWHMPTVVIHELIWFFKKAAPEEGVGVLPIVTFDTRMSKRAKAHSVSVLRRLDD